MPKTETACPTCREIHEPRGLVYDGKGINSCGMYRARIATFRPDAPEHLGPLFAAAPDLLEAAQAEEMADAGEITHDEARHIRRAAIAKAVRT